MSELSFLIDLLLNQKLPKPVKTLVAERIKEIESKPQPGMWSSTTTTTTPGAQAPSTMANLMKDGLAPAPPPPPVMKRIVGGEVDTGNGTRGPRKF